VNTTTHNISLPPTEPDTLDQDEAFFWLIEEGAERKIRFHVGVDISQEAKLACDRDRPHAYDAYYVADMAAPGKELLRELGQWNVDTLTCIAALGFGDIPVPAFVNAYNLVADQGWVVFNIKETFLSGQDTSGFSRLVKQMMLNDALRIHHMERYRHRISIDGRPLFYYLLVGRKDRPVPLETLGGFENS
jgi:hypothetical protein